MNLKAFALLLSAAACAAGTTPVRASRIAKPETVMITFHAKAGAEAELAQVIARHWETARQMGLVLAAPHVTVRGAENGGTFFVDVFTWKDADIPDAAPPPIRAIWNDMGRLTEPRSGRPALDIVEVALIAP